MNLNSLIFAAPHASYDQETLQEELIWIPRRKKSINEPMNVKVRSASQDKAAESNVKRNSVRKFSRVYKISHEDANLVDTEEISTRIQACLHSLEFSDRERREEFDFHDVSFSKPSPNSRKESPEKHPDIQAVQVRLLQENSETRIVPLGGLDSIKKHHHSVEDAKDPVKLQPKSSSKSLGCFPFLGRRKSSKGYYEEKNQIKNNLTQPLKRNSITEVQRTALHGGTHSETKAQPLKRNSITEVQRTTSHRENRSETKTPIIAQHNVVVQNAYDFDQLLEVGQEGIPCLLLKNKTTPTKKYLIYFHANSEDIYLAYDLLDHLKRSLKVNVIAGEYPGYGIYKGAPSETKIKTDAESIYEFVLNQFKTKEEDIILFGRSIGSGPAVHLASKHNLGALILMSSFTSVRDIAKDRIGVVGQYLIKNRFNNLLSIPSVNSPTLVIHGKKDEVISHTHAKKLYDACKTKKKIEIRQEMSHNQFDFHDDMSTPISEFLNEAIGEHAPEKEAGSINSLSKLQAAN